MSSSEIHISPCVLVKADTNSRQNPAFYLLWKQSIIPYPSKQRVFSGYGVFLSSQGITLQGMNETLLYSGFHDGEQQGGGDALYFESFFPFSGKKKEKQQKPTTCTAEKFGPRNSIFIAWFVNENKNKT